MIRRSIGTLLAPVAALTLLAAAARASPGLALVNESPSLPEGVYLRRIAATPKTGSIVAIPQPAVARPYLAGLGVPAQVNLLKRVAARQGAQVCARPNTILIDQRRLAVAAVDRRGARLPRWTGCRRLAAGELFLLGDTADSFDSRYFGPVAASQVAGVYREILTW